MNRLRIAFAAALFVSAASVAFTAPAIAQGGANPQIEQSSSGCGFKAKPAATS